MGAHRLGFLTDGMATLDSSSLTPERRRLPPLPPEKACCGYDVMFEIKDTAALAASNPLFRVEPGSYP